MASGVVSVHFVTLNRVTLVRQILEACGLWRPPEGRHWQKAFVADVAEGGEDEVRPIFWANQVLRAARRGRLRGERVSRMGDGVTNTAPRMAS